MTELDPSQSKLLGALTLTVLKHLGESTLVVDEDNSLCPDWRIARIGDVALLEKPADNRSPKRIDCYESSSAAPVAPRSSSIQRA